MCLPRIELGTGSSRKSPVPWRFYQRIGTPVAILGEHCFHFCEILQDLQAHYKYEATFDDLFIHSHAFKSSLLKISFKKTKVRKLWIASMPF